MFFPDRIRNIGRGDRVLEIGPGGAPHPRADVLLERQFPEAEAHQQRGGMPPLATGKTVVFYDGRRFPFSDAEFDYIICSHVIEHVEDIEGFCNEMFRVGKRGYIEFPTIYYEYLYNFPVHLQLVSFTAGELRFMAKSESGLNVFQPIQALFYRSLELGYSSLVEDLKNKMFQGVEWNKPFRVRRVSTIEELSFIPLQLEPPPRITIFLSRVLRWLNGRFSLLRAREQI